MAAVFEAEHLVKRYGRHTVLDSLCLAVPQGSIYGLVGENGAGKTTVIRLIGWLGFPYCREILPFW
jgi:ABC-2 type transport system ATP-binding protein